MILFDLDWVVTVPPTAILCTHIYGREQEPIIFGMVSRPHMIRAAFSAIVTGVIPHTADDCAPACFLV